MKAVEVHLASTFERSKGLVQDEVVLSKVKLLKKTKNKLILEEDLDWRIKSRATWIVEGDTNTKYFQNFASHRNKIKNTIWELENEEGESVHSFVGLDSTRVRYFEQLFIDPHWNSLVETMRVIHKFTKFIL